jgi:hypothetical protein
MDKISFGGEKEDVLTEFIQSLEKKGRNGSATTTNGPPRALF